MKSPDIVVGLQWGDEGKGKITDTLSHEYDYIVRYQGGSNAGHTIYIDNVKYVLHLIPSGILRPNCKSVITHGCVVNPEELVNEMELLEDVGVSFEDRFYISENIHITTQSHLEEDKENQRLWGSTGKGIGPTYRDKVNRKGVMLKDVIDQYPKLKPYMTDTRSLLHRTIKNDERVLFEGAQAVMLDVELGTYPYVTSSPCTANYVPQGSGLPVQWFGQSSVIGVVKAYTTRVAQGPFPSEILGTKATVLREIGNEYGATTGRPRRVGWLDLNQLKFACEVNGVTSIALTKLDTLSGFETVNVLQDSKYINFLGWEFDETGYQFHPQLGDEIGWEELPIELKVYVSYIETYLNVPITMLGVGPNRKDIIYR